MTAWRWTLFGYSERFALGVAAAGWLVSGSTAGLCALIAGTCANAAACLVRSPTGGDP